MNNQMDLGNVAMTLTFGDQGENHAGMEVIGKAAEEGFNENDLRRVQEFLGGLGHATELIDLRDYATDRPEDAPAPAAAFVLVIRGFLTKARADQILKENLAFEWDKKLWNARQRKVQNKHARHNVCFDHVGRVADFENGKGTIIAYENVPGTYDVIRALPVLLGEKGTDMICEGNLYFDVKKTGIGWHGDSERKKVVGLRIGASIPLKFRWWWRTKSFGTTLELMLNHGDAYIMSEKAVGWDWKNGVKYGPTLRHSAGAQKYTKVEK